MASNNPKHGDNIIDAKKDTFGKLKYVATFQFQKFLDSLGTLLNIIGDIFVVAAYGGIQQTATPAMADIDATFQTIAFDAVTLTNPRGVIQDFANDALIFNFEGIWNVRFQISIAFTDINSGRELQIRFFNNSTTTAGPEINYFVGRNQAGLNAFFAVNTEIPAAELGDEFIIQIASAADTFTGVSNEGALFEANHISEFVGDLT